MNDTKNMRPVIVRTFSAGVHFGYLARKDGKEVDLVNSRRIHYWEGANSCSGLAASGLDINKSRVAERVSITLTEVIEIIDCTQKAVESLEGAKWVS